MTRREDALRKIAVGDFFRTTSPNQASLPCLALEVTTDSIRARSIASRFDLKFDRTSGIAAFSEYERNVDCIIDSLAPLPPDVHRVMLGLDRKYASPSEESEKLTEDEKRALVFVARFYPQNPLPLPPEVMSVGREKAEPVGLDDYDRMSLAQQTELILANFLIPDERR